MAERRRPHAGGRRAKGDNGFAIVMTALVLIPLMIFAAIGVDIASWYARAGQLQKAADAASLAGTIWMPDQVKAKSVAQDSLRNNGIPINDCVAGAPPAGQTICETYGAGSTDTSYRVQVVDTQAPSYFGKVLGGNQQLTRSAEAEYFLPLPLGSPLNYFGGDATKNTTDRTAVSDYTAVPPSTIPCNILLGGAWNTTAPNPHYQAGSISLAPTCSWGGISATQNPGFWAAISGTGDVTAFGDAYSSRCSTTLNCASQQSSTQQSRTTGYWYVVQMPASGSTSTTISVNDAAYDPTGVSAEGAGDTNHGDGAQFTTEYRVYKQTNPLDINARVTVGSASSASQTDNSCWWQIAAQAAFQRGWKPLCTVTPSNGDRYLVNVKTLGTTTAGVNGYALHAISTGAVQPAVYAYNDMGMRNNLSGTSTFYLAEVGPEYAGKILGVDLFDAGDASGTVTVRPMLPSLTLPKPVGSIASSQCTYTASPAPNTAQGSSPGGATSAAVATSTTPSLANCAIQTTTSGTGNFNDEWLSLRINVPSTYTCTKGLNPETTAGSCWWGVQYSSPSGSNDVTVWKARIEGNPVHLTQ